MEEFKGAVSQDGINYEVNISPVYNEILNEVDYMVSCNQLPSFLLAWNNDDSPGFNVQGAAPYIAHDITEPLSIIIEHHYA